MKRNIKKSAAKTKPTQPAVLRVVSPIKQPESTVANLPVRPRDNRLPAPGSTLTKTYRGKTIEVKVLENGLSMKAKCSKAFRAWQ